MNQNDTIAVYTFEDADGHEHGSYHTTSYDEACAHAERYRLRVIENVFDWSDSELVRDHTGPGEQ
jgi:hypothetical protein